MKDEMIKELLKCTMYKLDKELGINSSLQNVSSNPNVGEIWKPKNLKEYYGIVKVDKYTVKIIGIGNELKTSMNLDDFKRTFEYYC